jgi:RHS repeat-associated protein
MSVAESPALGGGQELYVYDGDGQRVEKIGLAGNTIYVYDAFGQLAAEYNAFASPTPPCQTCYLSVDHLGSVRMVTDQNGNVVARHDFLPFGEEVPGGAAGRNSQWGAADGMYQRFTGQIRDQQTGLDYFNARYFGPALGRFTGADPENAGADPMNPQTWNAYAYVGNSPLVFTDPNGQFLEAASAGASGGPIGAGIGLIFDIFSAFFGLFGGGGGPAAPPPPPSAPPVSSYPGGEVTGLPPGSFPGGETLGLPLGMRIPGPFGFPGAGCDFGPCAGGVGASGYIGPQLAGAGAGGTAVFIDTVYATVIDVGAGTLCIGTGVCEVIAAGAAVVAVGAGAYIIYRKFGPSGKPKIHNVDYPSKKAAKDGARQSGKGNPVQHPSPKVGKPHFHPVDEGGEIIKDGVHHNYPR